VSGEPKPSAPGSATYWRFLAAAAAGIALLVVAVIAWHQLWTSASQAPDGGEPGRATVVVLPFENLGSDEHQFFVAGITEEITSRLGAISSLGVISRTSAVEYDPTHKTVRQIGEDLGVDYVLEGTVRWGEDREGADRVRITPQLIRASDDTHIWSEQYDRVIEDVFAVQSEIATQVITQLHVRLLQDEEQGLASRPTANLEAYTAYVRGLEIARSNATAETTSGAVKMFERAVGLDPGFVQAWVELSRTHSLIFHMAIDRSEERAVAAEQTAQRALELAPSAPEPHVALGYYHYWVHRDYGAALAELTIAEGRLPNDDDVLSGIAFVLRRQGRFADALPKLEKAFRLSPRDARLALAISDTHAGLRRFEEAAHYLEVTMELAPEYVVVYLNRAIVSLLWTGDVTEARTFLDRMPAARDPYVVYNWFRYHLCAGEPDLALERLAGSAFESLEMVEGTYPKALLAGQAQRLLGDQEAARRSFEQAVEILERAAADGPDDPRLHSSLGLALSGLGLRDEALRAGELATRLSPVSADAIVGPFHLIDLAMIHTTLGDDEAALEIVEHLLSIPSERSPRR